MEALFLLFFPPNKISPQYVIKAATLVKARLARNRPEAGHPLLPSCLWFLNLKVPQNPVQKPLDSMTSKVLSGAGSPVIPALEVLNESGGNSWEASPHCRLSSVPPAIRPAVPHPLCPRTAGWVSAVDAPLSGWHMCLQISRGS